MNAQPIHPVSAGALLHTELLSHANFSPIEFVIALRVYLALIVCVCARLCSGCSLQMNEHWHSKPCGNSILCVLLGGFGCAALVALSPVINSNFTSLESMSSVDRMLLAFCFHIFIAAPLPRLAEQFSAVSRALWQLVKMDATMAMVWCIQSHFGRSKHFIRATARALFGNLIYLAKLNLP